MRLLHTADWHLGDRLGRIDRTADLQRAVERIAGYCRDHEVDVLLVAGDLFSELNRADSLRASIEHLQQTFEPFLLGGGTILAVTGNHDNEGFCQTLRLVMTLAAPEFGKPGDPVPAGRLHLATSPTLLRLLDRHGTMVQFLLMPYPTVTRYLRDERDQRYGSLKEKNRRLQAAFCKCLQDLLSGPHFDPSLPTVLVAHLHVQGSRLPNLFRLSEEESIIFEPEDLPLNLAYVALGHIHRPQCLEGRPHVRYAGSIERLDLGEQRDDKEVVLLEIGPQGLQGEPRTLPLDATPIYAIELHSPLREGLEVLKQRHPQACQDLVHLEFTYTAGVDDLETTLAELDRLFPRWYYRHWTESGSLGPALTVAPAGHGKSFEETVRDYLLQELRNHATEEQAEILALAEELLGEVRP